MKKAVLVAAIVVTIFVASSVVFLAFRSGYFEDLRGFVSPEPKPELYLQVQSSLDTWYRDSDDNLVAEYVLNIEVGNTGDAESDWASIDFSIKRNGYTFQSGVIPLGTIQEDDVERARARLLMQITSLALKCLNQYPHKLVST